MTEIRSDFVAKRYAAERRFKYYGAGALVITALFLLFLISDIAIKGFPAFFEHRATVEVTIDPAKVDAAKPQAGDFDGIVKDAFRSLFPAAKSRADRKALGGLLSQGAAVSLAMFPLLLCRAGRPFRGKTGERSASWQDN